MRKFYDTCSLLTELTSAFKDFEQPFYLSSITLKELESIKTSAYKDAEIKYRARKLINLLENNEDKYIIVTFKKEWEELLPTYDILSDTNDSKIILSALILSKKEDIVFITEDLCCKQIARSLGLSVHYLKTADESDYTGFKVVELDPERLEDFYNTLGTDEERTFGLLPNQYLIIYDDNQQLINKYKMTLQGLQEIRFIHFNSTALGDLKPKDVYQNLALDSLKSNQLTVLRGPAGSGKSYLGLGYLLAMLEKGVIDTILVFCNTVATQGSAKLGYYPGTRDEKLLDSQIGTMLSSKLGDRMAVENMLNNGTLVLIPLADIRGYDSSGKKAGVYITEAQNLDIELMKLALQRIGEDSICILDGDDAAQVDMPQYAGSNNGLRRVSEIFRGQSFYGEVTLQNIYRSKIAELAQQM